MGREGSGGDKVVVMVDLVNHGRQSLDGIRTRGGVIARRAVREGWESGTNDWACLRYEVSRVEYPRRFREGWQWLQARQNTNTNRLQVGNMLGTLRGLRPDTVSHVERTDISRRDRSVVTWRPVDWGGGMEWLGVIAGWSG